MASARAGNETGAGVQVRGGVGLWQSAAHAIQLALEIQPSWYERGRLTSVGLQLGWQMM